MRSSGSIPEPAPVRSLRTVPGIAGIDRNVWQALQPGPYHPFTDWRFLNALEASGSVGDFTGWMPCHLVLEDESGTLCAAMPLYAKAHSQGEYIFDQGWADAAERAGLPYYPKLQCSVPFTPVTGPRILAENENARKALVSALPGVCDRFDMSGLHITFIDAPTRAGLADYGFLVRTDRQFHFLNPGFENFGHFLASLNSRKRKKIRTERRRATDGLQIRRLTGDDIRPEHWDAFFTFYTDTGQRKWGRPYLTRDFFAHIHDSLRAHVLLVFAYDGASPIAGTLHFIGGEALYGRHWGMTRFQEFLHFELCYYQAIETAIEMGLDRVEAGAQGEHKLARGYQPVATFSAHYLRHQGLRAAIADYLVRERRAVDDNIKMLNQYLPFRQGG